MHIRFVSEPSLSVAVGTVQNDLNFLVHKISRIRDGYFAITKFGNEIALSSLGNEKTF